MNKAIIFNNIDSETFVSKWDGVEYSFGSNQTMFLEDWKAAHFAKHLADKILNDSKLPTDHPSRTSILARILPSAVNKEAEDEEKLKDIIRNSNIERANSQITDTKEEVFEGLNDVKTVEIPIVVEEAPNVKETGLEKYRREKREARERLKNETPQ